MKIVDRIVLLAKEEAKSIRNFNIPFGPGKGNTRSREFSKRLKNQIESKFGNRVIAEYPALKGKAKYAFDYYIPAEKTVVEVALSLHNANTEFEKDILKVLLAKKNKIDINRLLFLGKMGSFKRMTENGPMAIRKFMNSAYQLRIDVLEIS